VTWPPVGERGHRGYDAERAFIRSGAGSRAFARRLALADHVFRDRHQHTKSLAEDATKPILVHKKDKD